MSYFVYCITSARRQYIGATTDPAHRLRQHNGELEGGAARTRNRGPWNFECVLTGFRTWNETLQFEWAFKYHTKRCRGCESRRCALAALLRAARWTSNAPLASEVPLRVEWHPSIYGRFDAFVERCAAAPAYRRAPKRARGSWKRSVGGVR